MGDQWRTRFLSIVSRNTVDQEQEFLSLVDKVENNCSLEVCRVLMKSFLLKPDHGTQERVISVLASADQADAIFALMEEMPRLLKEAP